MIFSFNKIFNFKDITFSFFQLHICSFSMRVISYLKDIKMGKNCKFQGLAKFKRSETGRIEIGNNCRFLSSTFSNILGIYKPCNLMATERNSSLLIGSNCGFSGTTIACAKLINIGNNVRCGSNSLITDSDWHFDDVRSGGSKPIIIKDGVWLGSNVVVLKGVTIGKNSLVAANSVVFQSIPDNCVAAGNPCVVVFDPSKRSKISDKL
jgi:acetyltransferase-like isoleucine patch superfamily enzyme